MRKGPERLGDGVGWGAGLESRFRCNTDMKFFPSTDEQCGKAHAPGGAKSHFSVTRMRLESRRAHICSQLHIVASQEC